MQLSAFTSGNYKFPEFAFIDEPVSQTSQLIDWTDAPLASVRLGSEGNFHEINLKNNLSLANIEELLDGCRQSLVGVGNETRLDETVRQSHEICSDRMVIEPSFQEMITVEVNRMMAELKHAGQVEAHLYKFVIYGPNDFFVEHLDTPHRDLMVATLSVELATQSQPTGGELQIGEINMPQALQNRLRLALFYHDTLHQVIPIETGYRISLIFDVVQKLTPEGLTNINPEVIETYKDIFTQGLKQLLPHMASEANKVKSHDPKLGKSLFYNYPHGIKIAIQTSHHYFLTDQDEASDNLGLGPAKLKGIDQLALQLFREVCPWVTYEIAKVNNNCGDLCYEQVFNIVKRGDAFKALYSDHSTDYPEYSDCHCGCDLATDLSLINTEDTDGPSNPTYQSYASIKFKWDARSDYIAIKDQYLMGDVIFLKTQAKGKLSHKSSDEVYLGNEGFSGQIHSNLAIIFSI